MLAGIKKGKKKRKAAPHTGATSNDNNKKKAARAVEAPSASSNRSIADELRRSLAAGNHAQAAAASSHTSADLTHRRLEESGRISTLQQLEAGDETVVVGRNIKSTSRAERLISGEAGPVGHHDMSIDEEMTRNVMRLGKNIRRKAKGNVDSDEEEHRILNMVMPSTKLKNEKQQEKEDAKVNRRAMSRELALNDKQDKIISKCWWWMESSQFAKHRLISLGNHVSLVMAPLNLSLTEGRHLYIVPIKHAESLVACEDEVWDEIKRFQTSLRRLFDKEYGQGVVFSETVLPTNNFWQTKLEVIPVKRKLWRDSELYFRQTLVEQADEFGTHNKLLSTKGKGIRRTVPKGFPYFFIEWDAPHQGYAQIIESSDFPVDFAADTVAGMAHLDPLRFKKKQKFTAEQERGHILTFLEKWKPYDWTEEMDG